MTGHHAVRQTLEDQRFRFEEDEAYRLAHEIADRSDAIAMDVRRLRPWVSSQLGRSGLSVLNNTAEAIGEFSPGEKAKFYRYACRSASETGAMVILLARKGAISQVEEERMRALLLALIKLLTRRARHFQRLASKSRRSH